jgi:diaminopimelate epimerase
MGDPIPFAKLSGAGNDHVCLDGRDGRYDALLASPERVGHFARTLCHRGLGIGADGVIFALRPGREGQGDLGARFFEPDGTEAELCGNGTACFVRWVMENRWVRGEVVRIVTPAGIVRGRRSDGDYVRVCIPEPRDIQTDVEVVAAGQPCRCDVAITGVPHAVLYMDDIQRVDMGRLAPAIRHHERFQPRGMNVNFVQVLGEGHLAVRTFEFGVEGETLACGTGSATAALLAGVRHKWPADYFNMTRPVLVDVRSGDTLRVYLQHDAEGRARHVCLETVVRFLYRGTLHPQMAARALGLEAEEASLAAAGA